MSLITPSSVKPPYICPQCNYILDTKGKWYTHYEFCYLESKARGIAHAIDNGLQKSTNHSNRCLAIISTSGELCLRRLPCGVKEH